MVVPTRAVESDDPLHDCTSRDKLVAHLLPVSAPVPWPSLMAAITERPAARATGLVEMLVEARRIELRSTIAP